MEKQYFLSTTFNEVIFSNRNKVYGAYELRHKYAHNVKSAMLAATLLFTLSLLTPLIKTKYFPDKQEHQLPKKETLGTVVIIDQVIPTIEQPKEEVAAVTPKEKVKTEVYTEQKIVPDDSKEEEVIIADQEQLKNAAFGKETIDGIVLEIPDAVPADVAPTGIDNGSGENNDSDIFINAEEMPEFVGGEKAMLQFIGRKIKYPAAAQRENIEGLVVVTFVVTKSGDISDVEIIKGLGYGTDEEAVRVVKAMPKWKPGKQNGRLVAVRYTLPIRFSLN
ncbi:energy transducer TonB [Pontibacter sp. H249]|uniref:energy transducer TonB n=1 Tax=Pontibacter sp. H249 TaxID=3133420 RepID=UPI0030BE4747